jgi:hypothetical protein
MFDAPVAPFEVVHFNCVTKNSRSAPQTRVATAPTVAFTIICNSLTKECVKVTVGPRRNASTEGPDLRNRKKRPKTDSFAVL